MYAREIDGQVYRFGVSGKLIRNVLVMFDWETDSLWSQLLGEAVEGPLKGTKLEPLAAVNTTWGEWKTLHPDTKALATGGRNQDGYESYYVSGRTGVIGETFTDDRLLPKELIHGVVIDDVPIAYPYSALRAARVVNDEVAGVPVVVMFEPDTNTALAFRREIEGQVLTFVPVGGENLLFEDQETRTQWMALSGSAVSGPLTGKKLERIPGTSSFWFGWKDFYQETLVYGQ